MAYVTPTAEEIKARFPEFAAVGDALITLVIAESEPSAGESWLERDRKPAVMFLTAHKLSVMEQGVGGSGTASTGPMTRRKVGDIEVQYGGAGGNGADNDAYASTSYGQEFRKLLRRNFQGTAVV